MRKITAVWEQNLCKNIELGLRGSWNIANSTLLYKMGTMVRTLTAFTLLW